MKINKLSILIPIFNEEKTILDILNRVKSVQLILDIKKEIIIIDDCSTDKSEFLIKEFMKKNDDLLIDYHRHQKNKGKGAAIKTGVKCATGDYLVIQDADLEYDPNDFNNLIEPVIKANADVVYGTRFYGGKPHRILFFWHTVGNKFITFLSNMLTNLNLTDIETCYKLIRTSIIQNLNLKEERFGFEPEVTAKIARIKNIKIYEVGISYYGRTFQEGKKINWKDGLRSLWCIIKYNIFSK